MFRELRQPPAIAVQLLKPHVVAVPSARSSLVRRPNASYCQKTERLFGIGGARRNAKIIVPRRGRGLTQRIGDRERKQPGSKRRIRVHRARSPRRHAHARDRGRIHVAEAVIADRGCDLQGTAARLIHRLRGPAKCRVPCDFAVRVICVP